MRDYANKEWNFIDFLDPITKEEKKAYKKRLQQDAEELFEYYLSIGEANVENKEKYIKEYKKRLEDARCDNIINDPDKRLHPWQDDELDYK
jgi:type IV secretory pathway VirB4 component